MTAHRIRQVLIFVFNVAGVACVAFAAMNRAAACTIVSGISENGQVWTANNNDGPDGIANYINVFPRTREGKYGYFTLSDVSPTAGEDSRIQGGMNEAGLTFDFNSFDREQMVRNRDLKKPFPGGDDAILRHILATMTSTHEVVKFFETYWFEKGFTRAQMHVADRNGCFAMIGPSGSVISEESAPLISTNFDIVGKEDGSTCWRYPIANKLLEEHGAEFDTMVDVCRKTAQSRGSFTLCSNVQNLTTGDVWFSVGRQFDNPLKTNISDMLSRGRMSYCFDDLKSLLGDVQSRESVAERAVEPTRIKVSKAIVEPYLGTYQAPFGSLLKVAIHEEGIELSGDGIPTQVFYPQATNIFCSSKDKMTLAFETSEDGTHIGMAIHEAGNRMFTAKRVEQ